MLRFPIFFVSSLVVLVVADSRVPGYSYRSRYRASARGMHSLLRRIFAHYDKEVMPTRPVRVHLDVLLLKVKSTVEKEGIFESVIALFMDWQDQRMKWEPVDFDNISLLAFDSEKVWLPDIALTNSADHLYSISRDFRFVVRVTHDGKLKFVPTGTARTWCSLRLLTFPFDLQVCSLEFESWSLDADTLQFATDGHLVVDQGFVSSQWHLCSYTSKHYNHTYGFTGETFARIRFDFAVRRKSAFYMLNIVFPCATLSMIQLLVYAIPSSDTNSDRIGFGTTNLLTLVVFQTIATEEMPKTSDAVTSLSKYIIALIILASSGILESVIVEQLLRLTEQPPPDWLVSILRFIPILWREEDALEPEQYTDEVLAKKLQMRFSLDLAREKMFSHRRISLSRPRLSRHHSIHRRSISKRSSRTFNRLRQSSISELNELESQASSDTDKSEVYENNTRKRYSELSEIRQRKRASSVFVGNSDAKLVDTLQLTNSHIVSGLDRPSINEKSATNRKATQRLRLQKNSCLWGEIVTRIDIATLIISTLCAILIPLLLFAPLISHSKCPDEYDLGKSHHQSETEKSKSSNFTYF